MDQPSTKERIVSEAARLFANKGYGAVNVAEIAKAVGIKAPSLYKHYKNKQEIFDAVVSEMNHRYEKNMAAMQLDGHDGALDAGMFQQLSEEQLQQMGKQLFNFFLHDDFRKLLTIEQFQDSKLAALFTKQYADDPLAYQGLLFSMLSQAGVMKPCDSEIMALQFYAPIQFLLSICDRQPDREAKAFEMLERHIHQFNTLYRVGVEPHE